MYNVWTSLVGAAPIDDRVEVIRPGPPPPSLGSTSNSATSKINPVCKTQENSDDEDDATAPGKVASINTQPIVNEGPDPYKWGSEDEDMDD
jgi:hypothetical protein